MYSHKSGAQKRKEKHAREEAASKHARTLFQVGVKKVDSDANEKNILPSSSLDLDPSTSQAPVVVQVDEEAETDISSEVETQPTEFEQHKDIGLVSETERPTTVKIEDFVRQGPQPIPSDIGPDDKGNSFPYSVLKVQRPNGEVGKRDWLVYSHKKEALFCFPCRLFISSCTNLPTTPSKLATCGFGKQSASAWKKLYNRIPDHEQTNYHKQCYLEWRQLEARLKGESGIDDYVQRTFLSEKNKWKLILRRILDVVLTLGERGLSFQGDSAMIGDANNGNFLALIELLSRYDPILQEHVSKVREAQKKGKRLQAHYLSYSSQNEFIHICAEKVKEFILNERDHAKYYSIMVDATPDMSHTEQSTFILRYLFDKSGDGEYQIHERFLSFIDDSKKTGEDIAEMILKFLSECHIPLEDCRGQGYDNASNMSGEYKGVQSHLKGKNPLCLFSPCGCHSLNLCGSDAAACCKDVVTFFGMVQTVYNICSSSPKRWEILKNHIGSSLHGLSGTRWTDRVASVRPFAHHLPGILSALKEISQLRSLTAKTKVDVAATIKYVSSFECILMAAFWYKVLNSIDQRNQVIQAQSSTVDVEVKNIEDLQTELKSLRLKWDQIHNEAENVAGAMNIDPVFPITRKRKRKTFFDDSDDDKISDEETAAKTGKDRFKEEVFFKVIDNVCEGLNKRYQAIFDIYRLFGFLWSYLKMTDEMIVEDAKNFGTKYSKDVSVEKLSDEILHLKTIHKANLDDNSLSPLLLLNKIAKLKLQDLFPNVCIALRIFLTLPVTVASAERSFSKLKLIKNHLRSTMGQERLSSLSLLSIESDLVRDMDFDDLINSFAARKARKGEFLQD